MSRTDTSPSRKHAQGSRTNRNIVWLCWTLFFASLYFALRHLIYWTPQPLLASAPPGLFSEERALEHVRVLSEEIGHRQVSTTGLHQSAKYLQQECRKLAERANRRSDLEAEVTIEEVSGSIVDRIFRQNMINMYRGLTNVVLWIAPKNATHKPAVLINAHYDSALGSPGAADCGSCVGIGIEVIRTLIDSEQTLPCPVLLLLNGGEETLLQAAHGFQQSSQWRDHVGAFINIESTGSGGGPILFQYTGSWTLRAFAQGVSFPRGNVLAQEIFETGVIPADTDFRMFSKAHHGHLPGVDLATVLDATSYHTRRDTLDRLKPGTTQDYGETVLSLTRSMMLMLDHHANDTSSDKLVYSDAGHVFLILYSIQTAQWLHLTPMLICFFTFVVTSEKWRFLLNAVSGMMRNLCSVVLGIAVPVLFGAARAALSGRPMVWFACNGAAFAFYWPAALLGFILPLKKCQSQVDVSGAFAGISLLSGIITVTLTFIGIGSSILPFSISLCTAISAFLASLQKDIPLVQLLTGAVAPCAWLGSILLVTVKYVMEKIGMAGGGSTPYARLLPDAAIGALNGFAAVFILQLISPLLTVHWKPGTRRRYISALTLWCLFTGVVMSGLFPYSARHPKRIMLSHICRQADDFSCEYVWSVVSLDGIDENALPTYLKTRQSVPSTPLDWVSLTPFDYLMRPRTYAAPPFNNSGPWGTSHPRLVMTEMKADHKQGVQRMQFELRWEKPGWGAMHTIGAITNWSLSDPTGIQDGNNRIRFAQDSIDAVWPFWIEIPEASQLSIRIGLYYPTTTPLLEQVVGEFPEWTTVAAGSSFVYQQTYPTM